MPAQFTSPADTLLMHRIKEFVHSIITAIFPRVPLATQQALDVQVALVAIGAAEAVVYSPSIVNA
jgi:hypothetical protein